MPVYWKCPRCRTLNSISKKTCSCGQGYPRSNNDRHFVVQVTFKGKRKTRTAQTLAQAREIEAFLKEQLIRESYLGPTREEKKNTPLTVEALFIKHYLPWTENSLRAPQVLKHVFHKWINPVLGDKQLNELSPLDVEELKGRIFSAGRSPRTAQYVLAILRAAINKAKDWGLFDGPNPASRVKIPKFDNRRVRFLSKAEAAALLEECRRSNNQRNHIYAIALMALSTGMRAGEIFRLKWQDVDFKNNLIHIRDPKSGENRTAFMSPEVKKELLSLREEKKKSDYVFTNSKDKPFKEVPEVWKGIIKKLGFNKNVTDRREKVVFHTLRHTFCSWLAMEGVPLHVIKELAGHKTIQMTERYSHLMPDVKKKAAEKVWEKLSGAEE